MGSNMKHATSIPGETYCKEHQGNHSHYDERNCTLCKSQKRIAELEGDLNITRLQRDAKLCSQCPRTPRLAELEAENAKLRELLQECADTLGICAARGQPPRIDEPVLVAALEALKP
jgi:hypothetical protein